MVHRVILVLALATLAYAISIGKEERITGGHVAADGEYPYMCSLRGTGAHDCGCVILNDLWILTSARCSDVALGLTHSIHVGSNHINDGGQYYDVGRVTKHELYVNTDFSSPDVAVASIKNPIVMIPGSVEAAVLPAQGSMVPVNSTGNIVGWGWTVNEGPVSPQLLEVQQMVMSDADCLAAYPNMTSTNNNICSYGMNPTSGFCTKDEGGPLVVNGVVEGIISWTGLSCSSNASPGVYVRVANYRDWIRTHTGA